MKYGGSWAKGFAGAITNIPSILSDWKARERAEKEVADAKEEFERNSKEYATQFDKAYKDGVISSTERSSMVNLTMVLGTEFREQWDAFDKGYLTMEDKERKAGLAEIDASLKIYTDFDPTDSTAILDTLEKIQSNTRFDSVKTRAKLAIDTINKQGAKEPAETFTSYEKAKEVAKDFPGSVVKFNASKGVYYLEGTTPAKPSSFAEHMSEQDRMLEAGEITFEEWKGDRRRLAGGAAPTDTYRTTSLPQLKQLEQDMLDAETFDEAIRLKKQYVGADYDPSQVKVYEKQWTDYQTTKRTKAVESTLAQLEKLLGEGGTLRPTDELELPVSGKKVTRTKADWYKGLYDQYIRQVEALGKITDIEKFKKLVPLEDMKELGFGLDVMGDKQMKDWETIWQK